MNIQELLDKGFSAKFIEENFSLLTGATPKETSKETPKETPKEAPKAEHTFTESEVKEIIKKYASMEHKKVEEKPLSKEDVINNILGISTETMTTPIQDIDSKFNDLMNSILDYREEE